MTTQKKRRRAAQTALDDEVLVVPDGNGKHRARLRGDYLLEDVHDYGIDRSTFTIFVGSDPRHEGIFFDDAKISEPGVDFWMANRFVQNLFILSGIDSERPILIVMASCGGCWYAGTQMAQAILNCPNPVTVLAMKDARSMTSIIPLAADRFLIPPSAQYMLHRGAYAFEGLDQEADTDDRERRKIRERMFLWYVARLKERGLHAKKSEQAIRSILESRVRHDVDVWFTADEAYRWGFSDGVFTGNWKALRAAKPNVDHRRRMTNVLRARIDVTYNVSIEAYKGR